MTTHKSNAVKYFLKVLVTITSISPFLINADILSAYQKEKKINIQVARTTIIADGIPGAGAICQIGTFHLGGPLVSNSVFATSTQSGKILDKNRLLIASSSNFGEQLGRPDQSEGSILSIDPNGGAVSIPSKFATSGGQVNILNGRVMLFSANNIAFSNNVFNPNAITHNEISVSNPTGISLNNAFGRPWFSNAPTGDSDLGTISVIDPKGMPLENAPDLVAGGVFASNWTNSSSASINGLVVPALATALLTKSPDQSGRAVFVAALADGSIEQIHVQKGVDLLAPPGTITPIKGVGTSAAESNAPRALNRVGVLFNWVPNKVLYITDPLANRIVALDLSDDGKLFTASKPRFLISPWLSIPVDIAPTISEGADRNFASNTTLGAGSDLYVLNRGNNTIARMTQSGKVIAARKLKEVVPGMRVAGIATSRDGRTIYVSYVTKQPMKSISRRRIRVAGFGNGGIFSTPAFGEGEVTASLMAEAAANGMNGLIDQGQFLFSHDHELTEGIGPLFNDRSCVNCHNSPIAGGMGNEANNFVIHMSNIRGDKYKPVHGGPIARMHSIAEIGGECNLRPGISPEANVTSLRSAFTLRGSSKIDNILDFEILSVQAAQPIAVRGKANIGPDGRIGHFGWKAQNASLVENIATALMHEMGITNPLEPRDIIKGCGANKVSPESDAVEMTSLVAFLNTIDPPDPTPTCLSSPGGAVFTNIACSTCHTPAIRGPGSPTSSEQLVHLYSDLLVHNMGPALDDGIVQGQAKSYEFRTAPLWRVSDRAHFLHDGRAHTIKEAIQAHGGQAETARIAFDALNPSDQDSLLSYLNCI
jgi:hypothetical protein